MMLVSDPHISVDGTNKLGRQLAQLFRQDFQDRYIFDTSDLFLVYLGTQWSEF